MVFSLTLSQMFLFLTILFCVKYFTLIFFRNNWILCLFLVCNKDLQCCEGGLRQQPSDSYFSLIVSLLLLKTKSVP